MSSKTEEPPDITDELVNLLPPSISNNPRKKMKAKQVDPNDLKLICKEVIARNAQLVYYPAAKPRQPIPKYPLTLQWDPGYLCYELNKDPVVNVLRIWNGCPRTVYIHCCGLWDETARIGASWCCHPRTRLRLASGMVSRLSVKATPRTQSSVPFVYASLQLAASHMRDHVVGYFVVPVQVKFLNYKPPSLAESE